MEGNNLEFRMLDCFGALGTAPEPRGVQVRNEGVAGRGEPPAVQGVRKTLGETQG